MKPLSLEELAKLSADLDAFMSWAELWHRQAGGYTASDTALTIHKMEQWADRLKEMTGQPEFRMRGRI